MTGPRVVSVGTIKSPVAATYAVARTSSAAEETTVAARPKSAVSVVAAAPVRVAAATSPAAQRTECAATTGASGGLHPGAALVLLPNPSSAVRLAIVATTGTRLSRGVK